MARELANLSGTIVLIGKQENIDSIYADLTFGPRNHINVRTGKAYTTFGKPELGDGRTSKGTRTKTLTFTFDRPQILGNEETNIRRHVQRSIDRLDVDVEIKFNDVVREEV